MICKNLSSGRFRARVFKNVMLNIVNVGQAIDHRYMTSAFGCLFLPGECYSVCLTQVGIRNLYIQVYMPCFGQTKVTVRILCR